MMRLLGRAVLAAIMIASAANASQPAGAPAWTAGLTEMAAWRLKKTVRLGGALSAAATDENRALVAAAAQREGSVHIFDAMSLKALGKIALPDYKPYALGGVAILPGSKRVAAVTNGALFVFDIASKALVQSIPAITGYSKGELALSKDGQLLYFIRSSIEPQASKISVFSVTPAGLVLAAEYSFGVRVDSFDVAAGGERFLLGTYPDNQLVLYNAAQSKAIWSQTCQCNAKFGKDGQLAVFAGRLNQDAGNYLKRVSIGVLDTANPQRSFVYVTNQKEGLTVNDVSPDGAMAAIGSTNTGEIRIVPISLENLRPIAVLKDNSGQSVMGAKFAGEGSLVSISGDNNARLWGK